MQPDSQPPLAPANDRNEGGHRGPLSRTWPQLFKKRRRYSPVRESAQQQAQQQQEAQHIQAQPQPPQHDVRPIHSSSTTTQSIASPGSSLRSRSIATDTASTVSSLSYVSTPPPKKISIARRSNSIAPAGSNGKLLFVLICRR